MTPDRFGAAAFDGRARLVAEDEPSTRTEAQRDRDRILYSSAFLRLGHVTQVTAPEAGRVFHTRLTHSLKVAQVARRIAEALPKLVERGALTDARLRDLDPDVVEAAALAHDLGHPPFGHIAERELHRVAAPAGGFEGNAQSFRIVTRLALRDWEPGSEAARDPYEGLNLTWPVLNGLLKYPRAGAATYEVASSDSGSPPKVGAYHSEVEYLRAVRDQAGFGDSAGQSVVAQIMDWADDLTYAVHDLEDFYRAGLVPLWRMREVSEREKFLAYQSGRHAGDRPLPERIDAFLRELADPTVGSFALPYDGSTTARAELRRTTSNFIGRYVAALRELEPEQARPEPSVGPQLSLRHEVQTLKDLVWFYVIEDAPLATVQHGQRRMIRELHGWYLDLTTDERDWRHFPPLYREWLRHAERSQARPEDILRRRIVTDFIAGMTETQVVELYQRMGGYSAQPVFGGRASG